MSGGRFNYIQYQFTDVIEELQSIIDNNGKELSKEEKREISLDPEYFEKYSSEAFYPEWSNETLMQLRIGIVHLKFAQIYLQRIDWLLSSDDSEESFHKRLQEDLISIK
jgi:hypothetical protein